MSTKPGPAPVRRPRQPCSNTSRSSTTGSGCTRPSAIAPRSRPGSAWKGWPCVQPRDVLILPLHSQGAGPDTPKLPGCAAVGDLSVEGLLFIPASDNRIGVPLLIASHETSDSVTVFRIDPAP